MEWSPLWHFSHGSLVLPSLALHAFCLEVSYEIFDSFSLGFPEEHRERTPTRICLLILLISLFLFLFLLILALLLLSLLGGTITTISTSISSTIANIVVIIFCYDYCCYCSLHFFCRMEP